MTTLARLDQFLADTDTRPKVLREDNDPLKSRWDWLEKAGQPVKPPEPINFDPLLPPAHWAGPGGGPDVPRKKPEPQEPPAWVKRVQEARLADQLLRQDSTEYVKKSDAEYWSWRLRFPTLAKELIRTEFNRTSMPYHLAKEMPPRLWPDFLETVQKYTAALKPNERKGLTRKLVEALDAGASGDLGGSLTRLFKTPPAEEAQFTAMLKSTMEHEDPFAPGEWYDPKRAAIMGARMAPQMGAGVAITFANLPAGVAFWATQIYPNRRDALIAEGFDKDVAEGVGLASAFVEGLIEQIEPFPGLRWTGLGKDGFKKWALQRAKAHAKSVGKEIGEEGLQEFAHDTFRQAYGRYLDVEGMGKWEEDNPIVHGIDALIESAVPVALLTTGFGAPSMVAEGRHVQNFEKHQKAMQALADYQMSYALGKRGEAGTEARVTAEEQAQLKDIAVREAGPPKEMVTKTGTRVIGYPSDYEGPLRAIPREPPPPEITAQAREFLNNPHSAQRARKMAESGSTARAAFRGIPGMEKQADRKHFISALELLTQAGPSPQLAERVEATAEEPRPTKYGDVLAQQRAEEESWKRFGEETAAQAPPKPAAQVFYEQYGVRLEDLEQVTPKARLEDMATEFGIKQVKRKTKAMLAQEIRDAESLRRNEGPLQAERDVGQGSQAEGGPGVQREPEAGPEARQPEVPQEEVAVPAALRTEGHRTWEVQPEGRLEQQQGEFFERMGVRVRIADTDAPAGLPAPGYFDAAKPTEIWVDRKTIDRYGGDVRTATIAVAAHETSHFLRTTTKPLWRRFAAAARRLDPGGWDAAQQDILRAASEQNPKYAAQLEAQASLRNDETAAAYLEDRFADWGFWSKFAGQHATLWEKIKDALRRFWQRVQGNRVFREVQNALEQQAAPTAKATGERFALRRAITDSAEMAVRRAGLESGRHARAVYHAAMGHAEQVTPEAYRAAMEKNPGFASLTQYTVEELSNSKLFTLYKLPGAEVYYAIKDKAYEPNPDDREPGTIEGVAGFSNEPGLPGVATPWYMLHQIDEAIRRGAKRIIGDCFDVRRPGETKGFLPRRYGEFGFDEIWRSPFSWDYYKTPAEKLKLEKAIQYWLSQGWKPRYTEDGQIDDESYPDVIGFEWKGTKGELQGIRENYLRTGWPFPGRVQRADYAAAEGLPGVHAGANRRAFQGRLHQGDSAAGDELAAGLGPGRGVDLLNPKPRRFVSDYRRLHTLSDPQLRSLGIDSAKLRDISPLAESVVLSELEEKVLAAWKSKGRPAQGTLLQKQLGMTREEILANLVLGDTSRKPERLRTQIPFDIPTLYKLRRETGADIPLPPSNLDSNEALIALVLRGIFGRHWYADWGEALRAIKNAQGAILTRLMGATASGLGPRENFVQATKHLIRSIEGAYEPGAVDLGTIINEPYFLLRKGGHQETPVDMVQRAFNLMDLITAKLADYGANLAGESRAVVDMHMARLFHGIHYRPWPGRVSKAMSVGQYEYAAGRQQFIARAMGLSTEQAMAALWIGYKDLLAEWGAKVYAQVEGLEFKNKNTKLAGLRKAIDMLTRGGTAQDVLSEFGLIDESGKVTGEIPRSRVAALIGRHKKTIMDWVDAGILQGKWVRPEKGRPESEAHYEVTADPKRLKRALQAKPGLMNKLAKTWEDLYLKPENSPWAKWKQDFGATTQFLAQQAYNVKQGKPVESEQSIRFALRRGPTEFGRPDLANIATTEGGRRMIDEVDEARNQAGLPPVKERAAVRRRAAKRVEADTPKELKTLLDRGRRGASAETVDDQAVQYIITGQLADKYFDSQNAEDLTLAATAINAYRTSTGETARILGFGLDPVMTPEERGEHAYQGAVRAIIEDTISRESKRKWKGAGRVATLFGKETLTPDQTQQAIERALERVNQILKQLGLDRGNLKDALKDPVSASALVTQLQTRSATTWDMFFEMYRNFLLSAPTTWGLFGVNVVGNVMQMAEAPLVAPLEMTFNLLMGGADPLAKQFGEGRFLRKMRPELRAAFEATFPEMGKVLRRMGYVGASLKWAGKSWMAEEQIMPGPAAAKGKWDVGSRAIPGKIGRGVRLPQTTISSVDVFFKMIATYPMVAQYAYRMGKKAGLKDEALRKFIVEEVRNTASDSWQLATEYGHYRTFEQMEEARIPAFRRSKSAAGLAKIGIHARKQFGLFGLPAPFVTFPVTSAEQAIARRSPLGITFLGRQVAHGFRTGDWTGVPTMLAQQTIAWALLAAFLGWLDKGEAPDDGPWITGAEGAYGMGAERQGKKEHRMRSYPPMTMYIPFLGRRVSYNRIEPIAGIVGFTADLANGIRYGRSQKDLEGAVGKMTQALAGQFMTKTFLENAAELLRIGEDTSRTLRRYVEDLMISSTVPNFILSGLRAERKYVPERRTWGDRQMKKEMTDQRFAERLELPAAFGWDVPQPRYDLWGRRIDLSTLWTPPDQKTSVGEWLFKFLLPVKVYDSDIHPGDRWLYNYNRDRAEDAPPDKGGAYWPLTVRPNDFWPRSQKTLAERPLTPQEWDEYQRTVGERRAKYIQYGIDEGFLHPDNPTEQEREVFAKLLQQAGEKVRSELENRWWYEGK